MAKSQSAFRTISEVAATLDTPTHVLRFWESKFTQIKPVKRAGGRRYYRPEDIDLLAGIKTLLHEQGMTIKGAQKLLREQGVQHVIGLAEGAEFTDTPDAEETPAPMPPEPFAPTPEPVVVNVVPPAPTPVAKAPARGPFVPDIINANQVAAQKNAVQIVPLIDRLAAIRDRIRASL